MEMNFPMKVPERNRLTVSISEVGNMNLWNSETFPSLPFQVLSSLSLYSMSL